MHHDFGTSRTSTAYNRPGASDDPSLRLWDHVLGDRPDYLEVFTGFWNGSRLSMPESRFYQPEQRAKALAWARQQDSINRECYFGTAPLIVKKRDKANVGLVQSGYADMDGVPLERCPVRPTAVVESSPGHFHAYWRYSRLVQPLPAEELNHRMALAIGADKSGWDLGQVLRVTGTHNRKRGEVAEVKLLYIDEDRTVDPDELDRILPRLPEPAALVRVSTDPISDNDQELLATVLARSPAFSQAWQGSPGACQTANASDVDWLVARELVRACGLDVDRAESIMRRCEALRRDKWDERRGDRTYLRLTLEKAAAQPFEIQSATPYRSDDPTTWPELVAEIPDAPPNGRCGEHCQRLHHPREQALLRQAKLVNETLQLDVSPIVKLTLLWLMVLVGVAQNKRETSITTSAKHIGEKLKVSAQVVRPILHGLARYDLTPKTGEVLRDDRGLWDLDSDRKPELGEYVRLFRIIPRTEGGYTGFLEAAVAVAPQLLPMPKREPRQKHEEIKPPPDVVQIRDCPGSPTEPHPMQSREVMCATCEGEFIEEVRYVQNATLHRSDPPPLPWSISDDMPERSDRQSDADLFEQLEQRVYGRVAGVAS